MITYVNNSNATKYSVLFEDATQALIEAQISYDSGNGGSDLGVQYEFGEDGVTPKRGEDGLYIAKDPITTIEKYFSYLNKLVDLGDANSSEAYKVLHSKGRRYTMLPLDEEYFNIDANKRTITVPSGFNSNGVAVQGDQLAEVLYFKIDRYFDAKDLDDADIFIQWTNANGEVGLSTPIVIDIESEPNKIIFGWALSERITGKAGTIQFAVRFYRWSDAEKTKLSYSLATQTSSVKINSTLDFKLNDSFLQDMAREMDAENKLLISRIQTSQTYVTDNEEAQPPIFVLDLHENPDGYTDEKTGIVYMDLDYDAITDKRSKQLKVQAKSPDSGVISYYWNYQSIVDDDSASGSTVGSDSDPSHSTIEVKYELTDDTTVKDKLYYKAETKGSVTAYRAFDTTGLKDGETPNSAGLYERIAICTVTQVGKFFATATNSKAGANSKTKDSDICIVPLPVDPKIVTQITEKETIVQIVDDPRSKVTLSVVANNSETNGTHDGALTYQWYMKNESDGEFEEIEGETASVISLAYAASQDPKSIEGYYKVTVFNSKNGQIRQIDSAECRVSYVAEEPAISFPASKEDTQIDFSNAEKMKNIKIELNPDWTSRWNISDTIQYQWYMSGDEIADPKEDNDIKIEGATQSTFTPEDKGKYYCVVTNVKNDSEASRNSLMFFVV